MIILPDNKYQVIYADPPWDVMGGPRWNPNQLSTPLPYPSMPIDDIKGMPVKGIADKDCKLFLWTINKYLPDSFDVMKEWGFKFSTMIVWTKTPNGQGLGGTFSMTTEYLLFGVRGKVGAAKRWNTTWFHEKRGRHSRKPDKFRSIIDATFPEDNKIELFARETFEGWDAWGNEV